MSEYIAFTQQVRSRFSFVIPLHTLKNAFYLFVILPLILRITGGNLKRINLDILSELFYFWNRQNDPVYKPKIHPSVGAKIGPLWQSFWRCHKNVWNVIKIPVIKMSEVYGRIFLTHH